ncbi:unnamed protein product [Cyprideis torosa]|uniref:Uncharacterized protein n=1 Tax=Cyprideis torosa TaxID=163714 RepID=A0A7R8W6D5_9CRUS|nr:unnamed protein product [Cyprideis torosa]CAG0881233.1 unnamed protein product [Cyprideis torosa]
MSAIPKKLVVVGDGSCGKTCLLCVFSNDRFPEEYIPTVFETSVTNIEVDGRQVELKLWDTAGQEDYDRLRPLSYPETDVILLCFSIDNPDSLENIQDKWIPEVKHFCPTVPVLLVGLKKDLRNDPETIRSLAKEKLEPVKPEDGRAMAESIRAFAYLECSAKSNEGIRQVFENAILVAGVATLGHLGIGMANAFTAIASVSMLNSDQISVDKWGIAMIGSMLALGAIVSSLFSGILLERIGRTKSLMVGATLNVISWPCIGLSPSVPLILVGRFLGGMGIGVLSATAPVYVCETVEPRLRGALASFPQLMVVLGVALQCALAVGVSWSAQALISTAVPLVHLLSLFWLPESPVFLVRRGQPGAAIDELLTARWGKGDAADQQRQDVAAIVEEIEASNVNGSAEDSKDESSWTQWHRTFRSPAVLKPFLICVLLFVVQQWSGTLVIIFYAGSIFHMVSEDINERSSTLVVVLIQVVATLLALTLLDRVGRRSLLMLSALSMSFSMMTLGCFFFFKDSTGTSACSWLPLFLLIINVAGNAFGVGPIPWFLVAELIPNRARGTAGSLAITLNLIFSFTALLLFHKLEFLLGKAGIFWLFGIVGALGFFFVFFCVPETRGISLEKIEEFFQSRTNEPQQTNEDSSVEVGRIDGNVSCLGIERGGIGEKLGSKHNIMKISTTTLMSVLEEADKDCSPGPEDPDVSFQLQEPWKKGRG